MWFALAGDPTNAKSPVSTRKIGKCFRRTLFTPFVFQMEYGPTDIGCNRLVWLGLWLRDWHAAPRGRARGLSLRAKNQCTYRRQVSLCRAWPLAAFAPAYISSFFFAVRRQGNRPHSHGTTLASVGIVERLYNQVLPRNSAEGRIESALKHYEFLEIQQRCARKRPCGESKPPAAV